MKKLDELRSGLQDKAMLEFRFWNWLGGTIWSLHRVVDWIRKPIQIRQWRALHKMRDL